MNRTAITLRAGEGTPTNIVLYAAELSIADTVVAQATDVWMYQATGAAGGGVYPIEDNVRSLVEYGPAGDDYSGDLILPDVGDVREGVGYGADGVEFVGILVISSYQMIFMIPFVFHGKGGM